MNAWELVHYSQGYEQGEKNGFKQGKEETMIEIMKQMMKSFSCSAERAMELLNISKEEQKIYLDLLSKS